MIFVFFRRDFNIILFSFKLFIILVFGVDLRSNVIGIGWERLAAIKNENRNLKVRFEIGNKIKINLYREKQNYF